jgi:hypothetical protein
MKWRKVIDWFYIICIGGALLAGATMILLVAFKVVKPPPGTLH